MLARYFIELPLEVERVERALLRAPETWVPGIAGEAGRRGHALLAEVGFGSDLRIARKVAVELGRPVKMEAKTVVPLRWSPSAGQGLFPTLDADLEVAPLGTHRTQLSMNARYQPPFGQLGKMVDRALLHRVAEATIKDFLDRVGEAIAVEAGGSAPSPAPAGAMREEQHPG